MQGNNLTFRSVNAKRRILVIEDEMINREILGIMLGDNYEVSFAETGAEALKILETQHGALSLLLLDLNLPDMMGIDILIRVKSDGHTARLPVIVRHAVNQSAADCNLIADKLLIICCITS